MNGYIGAEQVLIVGKEMLIGSSWDPYETLFEDDGDTGYFYAVDTRLNDPVIDALHIYNVSNVTDGDKPSKVQIVWSNDGLKSALLINNYVHAIFDFDGKRGYCRTGFPPITYWSKDGHDWDESALDLFK